MGSMKWYDYVAIVLLTAGGINWGLVGLFNFNLVSWLVGMTSWLWLERVIYILVGASGVLSVWDWLKGKFK